MAEKKLVMTFGTAAGGETTMTLSDVKQEMLFVARSGGTSGGDTVGCRPAPSAAGRLHGWRCSARIIRAPRRAGEGGLRHYPINLIYMGFSDVVLVVAKISRAKKAKRPLKIVIIAGRAPIKWLPFCSAPQALDAHATTAAARCKMLSHHIPPKSWQQRRRTSSSAERRDAAAVPALSSELSVRAPPLAANSHP